MLQVREKEAHKMRMSRMTKSKHKNREGSSKSGNVVKEGDLESGDGDMLSVSSS